MPRNTVPPNMDRPHTVLVVDDAPENIDQLCVLLEGRYRVKVATNGERALQIVFSGTPPDLVLLDVVMPGLSGFEVCRQIKADPQRQHIPILFVTALEQLDDEAHGLSLGAADYIVKPFRPPIVLARVRTHLALFDQTQELEREVQARTEELGISEQRARLALETAKLGIYDLNPTTGITTTNAEYARMLGEDPATFHETARTWEQRLHPEDRDRAVAEFRRYLSGEGDEYRHEFRLHTHSGGWIWVLSVGRIVERDVQGHPLRMLGIHSDISENKAAARRLELAASVFDHAKEGIFIVDHRGRALEVNTAFTRITGYTREDVLGQSLRDLLDSGRQNEEFYERRLRILEETGEWTGELWNRRKSGQVHPELLTLSVLYDDRGARQAVVGLFTDLTETKAHESQLEHIAHYDTLTGLPNRVLLADRLQQALGHSLRLQAPLAVAALDLDGFKVVNDSHGHDAGDALLTALALRMGEVLRDGDTLARIGGDEFVAVLLGSSDANQDFAPVLASLLQAAASTVTVKGTALQVSASMGVTLYPQDSADVDGLLRHADQAMYLAKQAGKNRYHVFDIAQDAVVTTQRQSLEQIRRGLTAREFVLYYQPKVNMVTGQVLGAEALIRWQHPERGLLPPGLFLPVIEDDPLSVDVGEWVLASALSQMAQWKAQGLDWDVSVNIGARQLQQENFVCRLADLLALYPHVNPARLELEILETSALEDIAWVSQVMSTCQALGVRFALDDFGTGYSSLTYLKRLPAELLKIDQSFVRDMLTDRDDLSIVQTVIGLAAAFHRKVIAEGVETIAHGTALISMGCALAQGYGIARPMPASDFPAWARNWAPDTSWTPHSAADDDMVQGLA